VLYRIASYLLSEVFGCKSQTGVFVL